MFDESPVTGRMTHNPIVPDERMVGEHYRVERELGHGGMSTVYLCTDSRTGAYAAVKVFRPELGSTITKERFFREIEFVSGLDHPHIPHVLESGISGETPYYAMDYVDGESLRERLKRETRLSVPEAVRITKAVAQPVGYAHESGILHRDIKPENVLLRGNEVFVVDFGVARAVARSTGERLTRTGITVGTPAYMSPEQVKGDRDLDYRSDIYSLGCVVYEMLAGSLPYPGTTPQIVMASRFRGPPRPIRSIRNDVPESVATALARAMARAPASRWQSTKEFADALSR